MRAALAAASAKQLEQHARDARMKSRVIQALIRNEWDAAAELYQNCAADGTPSWAHELGECLPYMCMAQCERRITLPILPNYQVLTCQKSTSHGKRSMPASLVCCMPSQRVPSRRATYRHSSPPPTTTPPGRGG